MSDRFDLADYLSEQDVSEAAPGRAQPASYGVGVSVPRHQSLLAQYYDVPRSAPATGPALTPHTVSDALATLSRPHRPPAGITSADLRAVERANDITPGTHTLIRPGGREVTGVGINAYVQWQRDRGAALAAGTGPGPALTRDIVSAALPLLHRNYRLPADVRPEDLREVERANNIAPGTHALGASASPHRQAPATAAAAALTAVHRPSATTAGTGFTAPAGPAGAPRPPAPTR